MKKLQFSTLLIGVLFAGNLFAQEAGEKKGWPSAERYSFISECIKEAKSGMSEDSARFYCYCMQELIELKYPAIEDVAKITKDELNSEAWKKEIAGCLSGFWGTSEREEFLSECIGSAKIAGVNEEKAKSYCECMLYKVEKMYPDPLDAGELTSEKLESPEWKKIIQSCLDF